MEDTDDDDIIIFLSLLWQRYGNKRTGRAYIREVNKKRNKFGSFSLVTDVRRLDPELHLKFFRMSATRFEHLYKLLGESLMHPKNHRYPISADQRLALCLRYLASGDTQASLAMHFRVSPASVKNIIDETCGIIWKKLKDEFLPPPNRQRWIHTAKEFWRLWHFPNCLGAIDGKHIAILKPKKSGTDYRNYKQFFSLVLMAVVDANLCFSYVSVGSFGREGDSTVFGDSNFGKRLLDKPFADWDSGGLEIPGDTRLPGTQTKAPHVFLADDAFPLKRNLMKPFKYQTDSLAEAVFNYRLSRARRIVENAFGILVARWRALARRLDASPESAEAIVRACIVLHNYLKMTDATNQAAPEYVPLHFADYEGEDHMLMPGEWRNEENEQFEQTRFLNIPPTTTEYVVRETFKNFFQTDSGRVPWQERVVQRQ